MHVRTRSAQRAGVERFFLKFFAVDGLRNPFQAPKVQKPNGMIRFHGGNGNNGFSHPGTPYGCFFSVKLPYLAVFARMAMIFRSFA